jgi:small subunit ribosomal protein S7
MVPGHSGRKHLITSGHVTGKATKAYDIVEQALLKIEKRLENNPIQVLVEAIENASARDEIITIEYAGARYPKAVEMAPQRRVDTALKLFVQGAYQDSFKNEKPMETALAQEILYAYDKDKSSTAFSKGRELERQADSSR